MNSGVKMFLVTVSLWAIISVAIIGPLDIHILNIYRECISIPGHARMHTTLDHNPRIISNGTALQLDEDFYTVTRTIIPWEVDVVKFHESNKTRIEIFRSNMNVDFCNQIDAYSIRVYKWLFSKDRHVN